jgi:hypothetical protein
MTEIKDFSKSRKRLQFRIDGDVFEAAPAVPAEVMISFAEKFTMADPTKMTVAQQVGIFREVLEIVLLPDSMQRMKSRMSDAANPVDIEQLDQIIQWLFEEYGMRPTTESVSSSNGGSPPAPGITSTEIIQGEVLISAASPSTVS